MKFINTKNGAIIESDSMLGGVWKEYNPSETPIIEKELEIKETPKPESKAKPNLDEYDDVTIADIKKELEAFGIEYNPKAKKKELWELMNKGR